MNNLLGTERLARDNPDREREEFKSVGFISPQHIILCLHSLKAHLHHYLHVEGMEQSLFSEAVGSLSSLIEEYHHLDATKGRLMPDAPRLSIAS